MWDRSLVQAAEQTAHPKSGPRKNTARKEPTEGQIYKIVYSRLRSPLFGIRKLLKTLARPQDSNLRPPA